MEERESIKVLLEAVELQRSKSRDYQNPNSTVKQADYYPNGVKTIQDILHAKLLRARSLLESGDVPKHESLEDTYIDLINYASFAVAYLRGKVPGQDPWRDAFNRPTSDIAVAAEEKPPEKKVFFPYRPNEDWFRSSFTFSPSDNTYPTVCWNATATPKATTDEEKIYASAHRRVFQVDVGDMPSENVKAYLDGIKEGLSENHEVYVDEEGKRHYGMSATLEGI